MEKKKPSTTSFSTGGWFKSVSSSPGGGSFARFTPFSTIPCTILSNATFATILHILHRRYSTTSNITQAFSLPAGSRSLAVPWCTRNSPQLSGNKESLRSRLIPLVFQVKVKVTDPVHPHHMNIPKIFDTPPPHSNPRVREVDFQAFQLQSSAVTLTTLTS